jgi:hypothetical protein
MKTSTSTAPDAAAEPPLIVRCEGERLHIDVHGPLDLEATATLADMLVVGADTASSIALNLTPDDAPSTPSPMLPAPASAHAEQRQPIKVGVVGPGVLQIVRPTSCWTIDISTHRTFRSSTPLDPRFVPDEHWTSIRHVTISKAMTTAVSTCGTVLLSSSG